MTLVVPTTSMDGQYTNSNTIAIFVKATNGTLSLGALAGGDGDDFAKIGLIKDVTDNKEATVTKRECENSKLAIKTIGQKKDRSIVVNASVPTSPVLSCFHGHIASYNTANISIPDDATGFTGEAFLVYLDEDEEWDGGTTLAHNGMEYWKSVRIIANGGQSFDSGDMQIYPFEIHLQRDSSGESIKVITPNDEEAIDVSTDYVNFSSLT